MKEKEEYIETLLERFFEGQTSNEEEQQLYLFFRQRDIPEEFLRYQPVVKYFESGLAEESDCLKPNSIGSFHVPNRTKQRFLWSSIAASFLICLGATFFLLNKADTFDPLEGSYIIRNGVRINDLELIRPELEATLQDILHQQEEWEQMYARFAEMESLDIRILIQIAENNQRLLEDIQDENIRKEVEELLYTNF